MKKIGGILVFLGLFAIVLNFLDRVPSVLIWIYNWGEGAAWAIMIALVVIGAVLFLIPGKKKNETHE